MTEARGTGPHDGRGTDRPPSPAGVPGRPPTPGTMPDRAPASTFDAPSPGPVPNRAPASTAGAPSPGTAPPGACSPPPATGGGSAPVTTPPPSAATRAAPAGDDCRAIEDLRAATSGLDELEHTDDPGEHADRFEAVHDALVAVLADVDRT